MGMNSRSVIDTATSDASMGIQTRYTANDWPLISIFSGMGDFFGLQRITCRSCTFGNLLGERGEEDLKMETTTHWPTVE